MRAIILILILLIVAAIAAIATGFIDINQTRSAEVPQVRATENGLQAQGGQPPAFDVQTGEVEVGTRQATVPVPDIRVNPADTRQPPAQANATVPTTDSTQP